MKPSVIFKRSIDIVMYVLFLLLMGQCVLRGAAHEWLGIAVGVLFVLHNVLNYRWYKALFKGKYTALRAVQTAVNFLLMLAVLDCAVSGVLISQHLFSVGSGSTIEGVGVCADDGASGAALVALYRAREENLGQ